MSALEEMARLQGGELQGAAAEVALTNLWRRTFTAYAAVQENWLERAFIKRGRAILDDIYPDADERARLYQYGFTPYVGQRFEAIAPALKAIIESANNYGAANAADRLSIFSQLGNLLAADRGYGFRVRATETDRALLENWEDVLGWWVQSPGATRPEPAQLRAWQRFVAENIEFRLGVATGAVVARAWSDGAEDPFAIPLLQAWRDTTGLPWFGFWARELLRWGTLDPFVAFALAQGLARTRDEAGALRVAFQTWLGEREADIESEDLIDPQLFLEWQKGLPHAERHAIAAETVGAQIVGTTGTRGMYRVIPVFAGGTINWLDAAGYVLAQSQKEGASFQGRLHRDDFQLHTDVAEPYVSRVFAGR